MKTLLGRVVAVLVAALALLLGYWIGYRSGRIDAIALRSRVTSTAPAASGSEADLRAALAEPDPLVRAKQVAAVLASADPASLERVRAAYGDALLDAGDVELVLLAEWWAGFDPEGALDWATGQRISWHPSVITAVFRAWARRDPQGAAQGRAELRDEKLTVASQIGIVRGWQESGRPGLEDYLATLPPGGDGTARAIEAFARGALAAGEPEIAMDWAAGLPDGEARGIDASKGNAVSRVAEALLEWDPDRVAAWVAGVRGDSYSTLLLVRFGTLWAQTDGAAALAWLGSLPPNRDHRGAVQEAFRSWFFHDPDAARAWIRSSEIAPWMDPAISQYAILDAREHPDAALEWSKRIADSELRERTQAKIGSVWLSTRPDDGEALIASAGFPDPVQRRIERFRASMASLRQRRQHHASGAEGKSAAPAD